MSKIKDKAQILYKLKQDINYRHGFLIYLYHCQTRVEKSIRATLEFNSIGFNSSDASFLCRTAEKVILKQPLTLEEGPQLYGKLLKYWEQALDYCHDEQIPLYNNLFEIPKRAHKPAPIQDNRTDLERLNDYRREHGIKIPKKG